MGNCIVAPSELRGIVTPPPSKSLVPVSYTHLDVYKRQV